MSACTSLENFRDSGNTPVALQPAMTTASTLPAPETTQSTEIPGDSSLIKAQRHFHQQEYGLSEKLFRQASADNPKSLDALLGLAASYDQLKRFDLATKTYRRAIKIGGRSPVILNNWGYSYLLRGNVFEARKKFLAAYELEPKNKAVNANLDLLREGIKRNRAQRT